LAGLKTIGWFGGYTLPCGGIQPSIGPPGCCIPPPGGKGPPVPGIIGVRGPIGMPGGQGCGPGMHPATVPGIPPAAVPGIIGIGPRGALMLDAADAENGDIGGMSATVTPADIRPPPAPAAAAGVALLLTLAGISSKPLQTTGIAGPAADVSLTGLNMSAMSDSLCTITTTTTTTTTTTHNTTHSNYN